MYVKVKVKVKWSRYRPGVAQRVGTGIALLFHDRGSTVGIHLRTYRTIHMNQFQLNNESGR